MTSFPRRLLCARRAETGFVGRHVVVPVRSLSQVAQAKFPVLIRLVEAGEKTLTLLFLGKVEEKFQNPRAIAVQMTLEVID